MIETARLTLIPATVESLQADLTNATALGELLGARVPANWPPDLYDHDPIVWTIHQLTTRPEAAGWLLYYFAEKSVPVRTLVGCGGYKGPPLDGTLEIGYSILEQYRRRGYASEATQALVDRAFADPGVERVIAETLPGLDPSIGVMLKCGFAPADEEASGAGILRYVLARDAWRDG